MKVKPDLSRFLMLIFLMIVSINLYSINFYVSPRGSDQNSGNLKSPFKSIEKARDAIRMLADSEQEKDIVVFLMGGEYKFTETLVFNVMDGAPEGHSVVYKAYQNEKPVITSAISISGWEPVKDFPEELPASARGNVWVADIPDYGNGPWYFRTMYNGDQLLTRAVSEKFVPANFIPEPYLKYRYEPELRSVLHFPDGAVKNWSNLVDAELAAGRNMIGFSAVDERMGVAILNNYSTYSLGKRDDQKFKSYWIENVIEALDQPGEWVINSATGKVYYWPENGSPGDFITAPCLDELIRVEGVNEPGIDGDIPVRGLIFEGLTFRMSKKAEWTIDDKYIQHGWSLFDKNNASLRFRGAEDCSVISCTFSNTGANAIRLDLYCQGILIKDNHLYDIGSNGIYLCGYGPGLKDVNKGNELVNNQIHGLSRTVRGRGILIWQSGSNIVRNNRIYDNVSHAITISGVRPRYFGIYDGHKWITDYEDFKELRNLQENMRTIRWQEVGEPASYQEIWPLAHARDNIIEDNEIHDVMLTAGDGNAIYLSGAGTGNIIRRNLIYRYNAWAIRTDDDQDGTIMTDNIIVGKGFKLKHTLNRIENNIMIDGGEGNIVIMTNSPDCSVVSNVFIDGLYFFSNNNFSPTYEDHSKRLLVDKNLFYSIKSEDPAGFLSNSQKNNYDISGVVGNPGFRDYQKGDFRLKADSPLHQLGFKEIDTRKIGLEHDPAFSRLKGDDFLKRIDNQDILDSQYRYGM